jgi:hypothetical protein
VAAERVGAGEEEVVVVAVVVVEVAVEQVSTFWSKRVWTM